MSRKWLGIAALVVTAITQLSLSSCARSQKLTGITIQPSAGGTFGAVDSSLFF